MSKLNPKIRSVRITAYETADGTRHETHSAAIEHDIRLQIEAMLKQAGFDGSLERDESRHEIAQWILNWADTLGPLLRRATQAKRTRVTKPRDSQGADPMKAYLKGQGS